MAEARLAGRYQPLVVAGSGGEATVLKAVDTRHERLVALKVRVAPSGPSTESFLAETRRLLSLPPHPGLAHARDDFFDGDRHVLVLDWVDGVNLARLLADEGSPGLPVSSVLRWMAQAAEALTVLHHHDVVHGDVKPANLILDHSGRIVVVDLGSSSAPLTATQGGGTSGYRAPEVAAGAPVDVARDVYGLAATAFALLTGSAPTGGRPNWDGIPAEVAGRLESALRGGLAVDPARRPATPGQLVERLRAGWDDQTPTGVGTVMLTDVVDSAAQWERCPERVPALLAELQLAVDRSVEGDGGRRLGSSVEGDATMSVFTNALSAVRAAIALQRTLTVRPGALRVRVGLATGPLIHVESDVLGPTVNRAARVRALGRAGEILLSASTADVASIALPEGVELIALGPHALRGLEGSDAIVAVRTEGVHAPPDPARCPYPGLAPFSRDDADLFFGREEIVQRCLELFSTARFVAVVGASGSGKSSVALAGIAPRLPEVVILRPGLDPSKSLERADLSAHESAVLIVDQLEELITLCDDAGTRGAFVDAVVGHPGGLVVTVRADFYGEFGAFPALADRLASSQVLLGPLAAADLGRAVQEPAQRCGLVVEEGLTEVIATELGDAPGALPLLGHALQEAWLRRDGRTITLAGYRASGGVRSAIATTAEQALARLDDEGQRIARRVLLRLVELRPEGDTGDPVRQRVLRADLAVDASTAEVLDRLVSSRLLITDNDTVEVAHEAVCRAWPRLRSWLDEDRQWVRQLQHLAMSARSWDASGRPDSELYRGARLDAAIESRGDHRDDLTENEVAFVEAGRAARDTDRDRERRSAHRLRRLLVAVAAALVVALVLGAVAVRQTRTAEDRRRTADEQREAVQVALLGAQARELVDDQLDLASLLAVEAHRRSDGADAVDALADVLRAQPPIDRFIPSATVDLDGIEVGADGRRGAGLDGDQLVRFTLPDMTIEPAITIPGARSLAMSPDSSRIAVVTLDGLLLVDAVTGTIETDLDIQKHFKSLVPKRVIWIGPSRLALRWASGVSVVDITSGFVGAVVSMSGPVLIDAIGSDREGRHIAMGSAPAEVGEFTAESEIQIFDARTGELMNRIDVPSRRVIDVSFQPGGDLLAVGTEDAGLYVVDTTSGETVLSRATLVGATGRFSPDGSQLAVFDRAGTLTVLEPTTGEVLLAPVMQARELRNVFFTRNGTELLVDAVTSIISVRMDGREPLASAPFGKPDDFPGAVRSDGEIVWALPSELGLAAGSGHPVESAAYRPSDGEVVQTVPDTALFYGPEDAWIYVVSPDGDDVADPASGATLFSSDSTESPGSMLGGVGPSGRIIAWVSFGGGALDIRRLPDLSPVETALGPFSWRMLSFAISTDGRRIAFAILERDDTASLRVFDIASGKAVIEPIRWPDQLAVPRALNFTPDDSMLAVGDRAGGISQVDLASGAVTPRRFEGLHGPVVAVEFTADGRFIAVSNDGDIWLFDATTRQPLGPPILWATRPDVSSFEGGYVPTWDSTDKHLVVTDAEGLRLWNIDPATWPEAACQRAGRNLTADEWARYMPANEPYRPTCPQFPVPDELGP